MENIAKALLIAAGMFLAVLLISLLVVFYNQMSDFYSQKHESAMVEQAQEFNARFENYNRNDIRGSDLISLMNRVIDYNANESYFEDKRYKRIEVTIDLKGKQELFKIYEEEGIKKFALGERIDYLKDEKITNTTGNGNNWQNDRELVAITNTPSDLIQLAKKNYINNMTDTKLQQLSSKIYTIFANEEGTSKMDIYNRASRAELIEDLLGIEIKVDSEFAKTKTESKATVQAIKEITNQYYQYTQFKRAYFDCVEMNYSPETGRVVEIKFEVQLDNEDNVVFN